MTRSQHKAAMPSEALLERALDEALALAGSIGRQAPGSGSNRMLHAAQRPLVSIVTPVYNEEAYIRECIESVLAQTYQHWDYTIVNNCSTDRTLEIAREYASRDKRIRVVTNAVFVPVIDNYNNAFRQISPQSKYCKVVAADDWIFPTCLEKMVGLAEAHPQIAIVCAYKMIGNRVDPDGLPFPTTVMSGRDACRGYLSSAQSLLGAATALLHSAEVVRARDAFYDGAHLHADAEACLEVLADRDFGFVHEILTYERRRESVSSTVRNQNRYLSERLDLLLRFGPRYFDAAEFEMCISKHLAKYYTYLGRQFGRRRGADFWAYHRAELGRHGYPLNMARVLCRAALHVIEGGARRVGRLF